ncbi:MAG: hypothetical protein B6I18_06975 [Bacteroidetes bacterium 4572_112]|nr:MAG: hypothetical protein B6I18_06975 [Bacteroidetes bacterium 4572_112]
MKNLKLLSVLFISMILLFASCGKDDDSPIGGSTKLIKKYIIEDYQYQYSYNVYGQLSEIYVGNIVPSYYSKIELEYIGNNLVSYTVISDGKIVETILLLNYYNNKPTIAEVYTGEAVPEELYEKIYFTYTDGNMTKLIAKGGNTSHIIFKHELFYSNDNVIQQKYYNYNNGNYSLRNIVDFTYDNKINPFYIFGFVDFVGNKITSGISFMDINNFVNVEISDANGVVLPQESFNRVFEYDANGYPTKCIMTSIDSNKVINTEYEYY